MKIRSHKKLIVFPQSIELSNCNRKKCHLFCSFEIIIHIKIVAVNITVNVYKYLSVGLLSKFIIVVDVMMSLYYQIILK